MRIVVPRGLPEEYIENILRQREGWIQKHLQRFRTRKQPIPLAENKFLFKGKIYCIEQDACTGHEVKISEECFVLRAGEWFYEKENQVAWYKYEARKYFERRVAELSAQYGFHINKIFIRSQKTRLGSCSRRKNLSLNWKLIKAPLFVIDYLILHELVHTEFMNHSKQYWQRVQLLCPEYKTAERWLKEHGREL